MPAMHFVSSYDYFAIGFYLVFVIAIGLVFRRLSKNTSDYFRAGGAMPWWITGTSAWIASFSAWTFTGAAGMIYQSGTVVLCLYYSAVIALIFVFLWTCRRFRRMRVVAWMEAVRLRYGGFSEQFYTWVKLPLLLFLSGISLNAIGVFMSSVFHIDMVTMLIVLGVIVTIVAFAGGAWAVLASDFVQMFLVMTITVVAAALTLALPDIGGLSGLVEKVKVPLAPADWSQLAQPWTIVLWVLSISWMQFVTQNNMENSVMYLMVKSDRDARRMVLIPIIGTLVGPLIWVIPALAASILHPNLAAEFPNLKQPNEAAFVVMCMELMPKGMLGLLICAMLGATLTSMDAGLNKGVGIFIRSFYLPLIDPHCSEKKLLVLSKICTLIFGVIIIGFALLVNQWRTMNLFDFVNQVAASLTIPLAIPLFFGLFYKRTPAWSAWSTGLVGFVVSLFCNFWLGPRLETYFGAMTPREHTYILLAVTTFGTLLTAGGWFFLTSLFYESGSAEHRARVEEFFNRLHTPVEKEATEQVQESVYLLLGMLCLVFGAFILLMIFIPNALNGRIAFIFCGGTIFLMGAILHTVGRRKRAHARAAALVQNGTSHPITLSEELEK
jgi:Na+/proline symporter